jgi:hypothetical protein
MTERYVDAAQLAFPDAVSRGLAPSSPFMSYI